MLKTLGTPPSTEPPITQREFDLAYGALRMLVGTPASFRAAYIDLVFAVSQAEDREQFAAMAARTANRQAAKVVAQGAVVDIRSYQRTKGGIR